jgi:hypothetical protein
MRTTREHAPAALGDQAVIELPRRETLALLEPGLGIIDLGPMTSGQGFGGLPTGTSPPSGDAAPTTGMDLPTTSLPGKLF